MPNGGKYLALFSSTDRVRGRTEAGRTFAYNRALVLACQSIRKPEYAAVLDDDEFPAPHWLEHMIQTASRFGADTVGGPVFPAYASETGRGTVGLAHVDRRIEEADTAQALMSISSCVTPSEQHRRCGSTHCYVRATSATARLTQGIALSHGYFDRFNRLANIGFTHAGASAHRAARDRSGTIEVAPRKATALNVIAQRPMR
jgi:hypothetical protein